MLASICKYRLGTSQGNHQAFFFCLVSPVLGCTANDETSSKDTSREGVPAFPSPTRKSNLSPSFGRALPLGLKNATPPLGLTPYPNPHNHIPLLHRILLPPLTPISNTLPRLIPLKTLRL